MNKSPDEGAQGRGKGAGELPERKPGRVARWLSRWDEHVSAVLLACATVGSAWCAYQSTRWGSVMVLEYTEAMESRDRASQLGIRAVMTRATDVGLFTEYAVAISEGQTALADFMLQRFRPPLRAAVETWLATRPLKNADSPATPFVMPEYTLDDQKESERLWAESDRMTEDAKLANFRSDMYILLTVFYAITLFFSGLSTKFRRPALQGMTLGAGAAILAITTVLLAFFPVH